MYILLQFLSIIFTLKEKFNINKSNVKKLLLLFFETITFYADNILRLRTI